MKVHIGKKGKLAILAVVVCILFAFGFIASLSIGVSQTVAVIEALDDEKFEKLAAKPTEEPEEEIPEVGDASEYYDKYHVMCDIMLASGYCPSWDELSPLPGESLEKQANFGGYTRKYLYLYSLFCEICMRDEINPGIQGAAWDTNPDHSECKLTLLPVYYFFGKTLNEGGLYVDYNFDPAGAQTLKDFWFSRDYMLQQMSDKYTKDEQDKILGNSVNEGQFGFLLNEGEYLQNTTGATAFNSFIRTWSSSFTDKVPLAYMYSPPSGSGVLWISSPCGQLNTYSANWDTPGNSSAFIFISKQENPSLDRAKRAAWGYRAGFYRPADLSEQGAFYKTNIEGQLTGPSSNQAKALEEYCKNSWPTAHYVNSGDFWLNPDQTFADYDVATYEELSGDIRYGNMDLANPVCYKSRPASYYLADSLYTLAWELRNRLQGGAAVTGSGRGTQCAYDTFSCVSDVSDNSERNLRILALAASTQWLPYDGPTCLNESLKAYGTESILDITENSFGGISWDSQFCGVHNLQTGIQETKKIQNVIQSMWDSYLDTSGTTEADAFSEIGVKPSSSTGAPADGTGDKLVFPIPDPCRIICAFGVGAKETGYLDNTHGGIDINFLGDIPGDSSSGVKVPVYAIADGTVFDVSNSCVHWNMYNDGCGGGLGNYVRIRHETVDGQYIYSTYGHLMLNSIQVELTGLVKAGDIIGYMGSTGSSTGPHLHLALSYTSEWIWLEPLAYEYQVFNPDTKTYRDLLLTDVGDAECNAYYSKHAKDNVMPVVGRYDDPADPTKHLTRLEFKNPRGSSGGSSSEKNRTKEDE